METFIQNVCFGFRILRRNPAISLLALLTLALGIGANTAIFSAVYGILFRPLPFHEPDRLVAVWTRAIERPGSQYPASLPDIKDWQSRNNSMEGIAAYAYNRYKIGGPESDELTRAAIVTADFFSVLGAPPALGRLIGPEDEHIRVTVLSHQLWLRLFRGDSEAIGHAIRLNDDEYTIVGVMPASFRFPTPDVDLWVSMSQIYATSGKASVANWLTNRSMRGYRPFARLKEGVSFEQAQTEMDSIQTQLGEQYPEDDQGLGISLVPVRTQMLGAVERPLMVLLAGVGFVLLIACVNVASLMLVRATSRQREMAVRRALGASGGRIVGQILVESMLLALAGGLLGALLALWGVDVLVRLSPAGIPRLESVRVDQPVLLFAFAVTVATGILFGLAPALRMRRTDIYNALRDGSRDASDPAGSRRARQVLVVAEVALAVVLVVGAGLMINSFIRLMRVDPGFAPDHLLSVGIDISINRYQKTDEQVRYLNKVLEGIRSVPGVLSVGACTSLPPNLTQEADAFSVDDEGVTAANPSAWLLPATPGFIETLGLRVLSGRTLAESDDASQTPIAIINRGISDRYFSGRDAVGARITISGVPRTIVGVVGDTKYDGLAAPSGYQVYVPYSQRPFPGMRVVLRASTNPASLIGSVRDAIRSVDPFEQGSRFVTMEQLLALSIDEPRFYTFLLSAFGFVALVLAAVGVFGVISYTVSRRTREIGVRVALGASSASLLVMVLGESLRVIAAGLVLGVAGAFALTRLLDRLLFEVRPADPLTFGAVVALLLGVGLAAAFFPARRAARVDPMVALRCD